MTDLIAVLQAAREGSRALSDEVLLACGWTYVPPDSEVTFSPCWYAPDGTEFLYGRQPDPTRNEHGAIALLRALFPNDGVAWTLIYDFGGRSCASIHAAATGWTRKPRRYFLPRAQRRAGEARNESDTP